MCVDESQANGIRLDWKSAGQLCLSKVRIWEPSIPCSNCTMPPLCHPSPSPSASPQATPPSTREVHVLLRLLLVPLHALPSALPLPPSSAGDPAKDVAVLQLQAPPEVLANLKPVSLGASSSLVVGQKVRLAAP